MDRLEFLTSFREGGGARLNHYPLLEFPCGSGFCLHAAINAKIFIKFMILNNVCNAISSFMLCSFGISTEASAPVVLLLLCKNTINYLTIFWMRTNHGRGAVCVKIIKVDIIKNKGRCFKKRFDVIKGRCFAVITQNL